MSWRGGYGGLGFRRPLAGSCRCHRLPGRHVRRLMARWRRSALSPVCPNRRPGSSIGDSSQRYHYSELWPALTVLL
jgi:hypothetical protein